MTNLPDDAVERAARALESTFAADAERFHGAIKWSAYARAALEAARWGEMREALDAIDKTAFIAVTTDSDQTRRVGIESIHDIVSALLSTIGAA